MAIRKKSLNKKSQIHLKKPKPNHTPTKNFPTKLEPKKRCKPMLETHQTTSKLAHAYVETMAKSTKLTKTNLAAKAKQQNQPKNNPARKFLLPGGGTKWPLSIHLSDGQKIVKDMGIKRFAIKRLSRAIHLCT